LTGGIGGTGGSTGGVGGTGGSTGGTGGGAGKGGTTGIDAGAGTIMCGTSICRPVTGGPLGTLPPCCSMDMPNACGAILTVAGGACATATPGKVDARCPPLMVAGGITLNGCCRPNGMCGLNLDIIGLGCNDPMIVGGGTAGRCGPDGG
jgi:hypothetical protein